MEHGTRNIVRFGRYRPTGRNIRLTNIWWFQIEYDVQDVCKIANYIYEKN